MKILKNKKFYILLGVVLLLLLNVGVCFNPFDNGGCISVTFDKLPMMVSTRGTLWCFPGFQTFFQIFRVFP